MPERLPVPGEDDGSWGSLLNAWLLVEHNPDGTHAAAPPGPGGNMVLVAEGNASVAYSFTNAAEQLGAPVSLADCLGIVVQVSNPTGDGVAAWPADGFRVQLLSTDTDLSATAACTEALPSALVLVPSTADELASVKVGQVSDGSASSFTRTVDFVVTLLIFA